MKNTKKMIYSFEVFPPKPTTPVEKVSGCFEKLAALRPDFISVTYGAGGGLNGGKLTCELSAKIQNTYHVKSIAHLPCISYSKEEIAQVLQDFKANGITDILALRGDKSPERPEKTDFKHASDLIDFIKSQGDFEIYGACYPEVHPEAISAVSDLQHLKEKVDKGAKHLISQLFFDNQYFYEFREKCEIIGIHVPIEAGIMPVVNASQIQRMVSLCGTSLPRKFTVMMQRFGHSPEAIRDAGIAYAVDQIVDLAANGVDGIHLYTMNNPYVAERITQAVSGILGRCEN
ncbi:MAG: methylenetetrahydrofolate reductase [NAD(P)H] [Oscillospiraceae bacterium]|nr:methylenetetrahydrofolate reductase [NAD(P)H] [Oscillospiraceae bacterium]